MKRSHRGDVYWVALDPVVGTEIQKTRPGVVVSNEAANRVGSRVIILPCTTRVDHCHGGQTLVDLQGRTSRVLGDQIRAVDRHRLLQRIGRLTAEEMRRVDEALKIALALT